MPHKQKITSRPIEIVKWTKEYTLSPAKSHSLNGEVFIYRFVDRDSFELPEYNFEDQEKDDSEIDEIEDALDDEIK